MRLTIPVINLSHHGGVRVIVELANIVSAGGVCVTILHPKGRRNCPYTLSPSVRIQQMGIHTGIKCLDYAVFLLLVGFNVRTGTILPNFFVTWYSSLVSRTLFKTNHFYLVQEMEAKYREPPIISVLLNAACRLTYHDKRIITTNKYVSKQMRMIGAVVHREVQIGIEDVFFTRAATDERKADVLYFLRTEKWKRPDRFWEIQARTRSKVRFLCVVRDGQGTTERHGNIDYLHSPSDDQLIHSIDSVKLLLLTSTHEGFSLPPLECMARGKPCILFPCGGPTVYLRNGENGLLVSTIEDAVETILSVLTHADLYKKLSECAMRTAREYTLDRFGRELLSALGIQI